MQKENKSDLFLILKNDECLECWYFQDKNFSLKFVSLNFIWTEKHQYHI